jgi:hypothetical protein
MPTRLTVSQNQDFKKPTKDLCVITVISDIYSHLNVENCRWQNSNANSSERDIMYCVIKTAVETSALSDRSYSSQAKLLLLLLLLLLTCIFCDLTLYVSTYRDRAANKNSFLVSFLAMKSLKLAMETAFFSIKKDQSFQFLLCNNCPNKTIVQYLNLNIAGITDTVNIIIQNISVLGMELSIDFRNWRTLNAVPESSEMVYLELLIPDKVMSWKSPSDHAMCNFVHHILNFFSILWFSSDLEDNWNWSTFLESSSKYYESSDND